MLSGFSPDYNSHRLPALAAGSILRRSRYFGALVDLVRTDKRQPNPAIAGDKTSIWRHCKPDVYDPILGRLMILPLAKLYVLECLCRVGCS